jgi:RecB family endonuclease NucS
MIKDENILSNPNNVNIIIINGNNFEENLNFKNRFNTLVLKNKDEFNTYVEERNINIQNNTDELFNDYIAIVSYTNMTSSGTIDFYGLYENNNNMYIYLKLITGEITTTDIVTRGIISFIDKEYANKTFETLTKYIIESK